jgi:hypothetical protein
MTREEILVEISKVKRVCRGKPLFEQATRDSLTAKLGACRTDEHRIALLAHISTILDIKASLPADMGGHAIQSLIYSFKENCGHDFNKVISTYPFDGKIRDVKCPGCGAPQHFQSPSVE